MAKWDLSKLPQGRKPLGDDWFANQLHPSPEAVVRAALERAAEEVGDWGRLISGSEDVTCEVINDIVTLADNPAEVAAIIKKAGETND